jgi:GNAT superfamily N-acetyltransferase
MTSTASTPSRTFDDGAILRPALRGDEDGILAAIRALAEYEREPDAVENTAADIAARLFGDHPQAFAHVVEREGVIVGIAVWFLTYSTWTGRHGVWLEDLFVDEAHRGRGYGKALIAALAAIAVERGYPRLEWTVLDWNAPSIAFYRSLAAVPMEEWTTQRLTGDAVTALASS